MKLAEKCGVEACISKTPSFEYWDETPAQTKIESMATYLRDVSLYDAEMLDLARSVQMIRAYARG